MLKDRTVNSYNSTLHERGYNREHDPEYGSDYGLDEPAQQDREISLGATTILGIFFGLALVCSLFFGLGYSMGHRSAPVAAAAPTEAPAVANTSAPKPSSGSLAETSSTLDNAPATVTPQEIATPRVAATVSPAAMSDKNAPRPSLAPPAIATGGTILVQIAAVSHREDADNLLAALKQRGYDVAIRNEPQDKLLHVQVGPFPTRKDADAMKQHLLADGYNAIIK